MKIQLVTRTIMVLSHTLVQTFLKYTKYTGSISYATFDLVT